MVSWSLSLSLTNRENIIFRQQPVPMDILLDGVQDAVATVVEKEVPFKKLREKKLTGEFRNMLSCLGLPFLVDEFDMSINPLWAYLVKPILGFNQQKPITNFRSVLTLLANF